MKSFAKTAAAAFLSAGLSLASPTSAQQAATQTITIDDMINTLKDRFGEQTELIVSRSATATKEDDTVLLLNLPYLEYQISTCEKGGRGITSLTGLAFSFSDLNKKNQNNTIKINIRRLKELFEQANNKRSFEIAPDVEASTHSSVGNNANYFYKEMADTFEAETGVSVTAITAIIGNPKMRCNVPIEEMFDKMPPEVKEFWQKQQQQQNGGAAPLPAP